MFGNLLSIAQSVIPQQVVGWVKFVSRVQDERGRWINTFAPAVDVVGSFQAVDSRTMKEMGFDTKRKYMVLYTSHDVSQVNQGTAPDRITYGGQVFDVVGEPGDWFQQDGWKSVYCVRIAVEPAP